MVVPFVGTQYFSQFNLQPDQVSNWVPALFRSGGNSLSFEQFRGSGNMFIQIEYTYKPT